MVIIFIKVKNLTIDLFALLFIGLSVGCTLGIVSNLFVKGVASLTNLRKILFSDSILSSFTPIVSLLIAAIFVTAFVFQTAKNKPEVFDHKFFRGKDGEHD